MSLSSQGGEGKEVHLLLSATKALSLCQWELVYLPLKTILPISNSLSHTNYKAYYRSLLDWSLTEEIKVMLG